MCTLTELNRGALSITTLKIWAATATVEGATNGFWALSRLGFST